MANSSLMKPVRMVALLMITFLVFYPLSIGPAYRLEFALRAKALHIDRPSYLVPSKTFLVCYWPIIRLAEEYPPMALAIEWYMKLWFPSNLRD